MESATIIQLTEERLRELLVQSAKLAVHQALQDAGVPVREYYTRAEMHRRHGRRIIESLLKDKKLTPHKMPETEGERNRRIVYSEKEFLSQII